MLLHHKAAFGSGNETLRANTQSPPPKFKLGNNDVSGSTADSTYANFGRFALRVWICRIRVWVLLLTSRRVSRSQINFSVNPRCSPISGSVKARGYSRPPNTSRPRVSNQTVRSRPLSRPSSSESSKRRSSRNPRVPFASLFLQFSL